MRRHTSPHRPRGFVRGPRIADQMTADHSAFVESMYAAERAGDAEAALAYHRGVPMFRRSAHAVVLSHLAGLADEMTPWLWARWAAYQTTRAEDPGTEIGEISRAALSCSIDVFYADLLQRAWDEGADPIQLGATTVGQDWVFHQLCTYDLGGLELFCDDLATGRLAEHLGLAREWARMPMGGYRLEGGAGDVLVVRDLRDDSTHALLDLGARTYADEDGWLLGRLVPSGVSPTLMFDTRPLPVDERTAREVAAVASPGGWVAPLAAAVRDGRVDRALLRSEDRELASDVAGLHLLERGTDPAALSWTLTRLGEGRDEIGRAAYRLLARAADGALDEARDAVLVAAAVVNPHGWAEARRRLSRPDLVETWKAWSGRVPEPARGRLLRLAQEGSASEQA